MYALEIGVVSQFWIFLSDTEKIAKPTFNGISKYYQSFVHVKSGQFHFAGIHSKIKAYNCAFWVEAWFGARAQ